MADRQHARPLSSGLPICALLGASLAGLYAIEAAALPAAHPRPGPPAPVVLVDDPAAPVPETAAPPAAGGERAPFAELNEALAAARARLEELSKAAAVAANAGQARQELETVKQENERLTAEVTALRASRDELQRASQSAEARVAELTKAVEDAAGEAKRIEEELVALRWQNAQLNTSLARAQAARETIELEAREAQQDLAVKVERLSTSAGQSAAEIARLRQELDGARQELETATSARAAAEGRLGELEAAVQSAEGKSTRLDEQVAALGTQLSQTQDQRDLAQRRVEELLTEAERLRTALGSAQTEAERVARSNGELEQEVAQLRAAADSAADLARQNLLEVEERIKELNAALVGIAPAAGGTPASAGEAAAPAAPEVRAPAPPDPVAAPLPAPAAARATAEPEANRVEVAADTSEVDTDLELIKSAHAAERPVEEALTRLTTDLPLEMRLQVQGLLIDLGAKVDQRGVRMTVPGADLFEINSDSIEPTAHDTLAKVAELIDAYQDNEVVIVGHTDAIGDDSYNRILSQRRANLVKQFFVENFEIPGDRLKTEGQGEGQPIASNETVEGRQANRRVEVLILN
jgi:outer membrane protein OmpA-like peptidoglycan-associated protein